MERFAKVFVWVVLGVILLAVLGGLVASAVSGAGPQPDVRKTWVTELCAKAKPSVVGIKWKGRSQIIGTGFVIDGRGWIVTCRHAISNDTKNYVRLSDGTEVEPWVKVSDKHTDIAVLKVDLKKKLPPLRLAAEALHGERVLVYGHPMDLSYSASLGIVSALNRTLPLPSGAWLSGAFQTDAAINPGNSGGPVLNAKGEVIGMALAIRQECHAICFATHAQTIRKVLARELAAEGVGSK